MLLGKLGWLPLSISWFLIVQTIGLSYYVLELIKLIFLEMLMAKNHVVLVIGLILALYKIVHIQLPLEWRKKLHFEVRFYYLIAEHFLILNNYFLATGVPTYDRVRGWEIDDMVESEQELWRLVSFIGFDHLIYLLFIITAASSSNSFTKL